MARKPTGKPAGRPIKPVDWTLFEDLCSLQCTQEEMADVMHCDQDTLRAKVKKNYGEDYSVIYKRFSSPGKISLRRYQFRQAERNATMSIWLGKQWLDQKDTPSQIIVSPEIEEKFDAVMGQIKRAQDEKKR